MVCCVYVGSDVCVSHHKAADSDLGNVLIKGLFWGIIPYLLIWVLQKQQQVNTWNRPQMVCVWCIISCRFKCLHKGCMLDCCQQLCMERDAHH